MIGVAVALGAVGGAAAYGLNSCIPETKFDDEGSGWKKVGGFHGTYLHITDHCCRRPTYLLLSSSLISPFLQLSNTSTTSIL